MGGARRKGDGPDLPRCRELLAQLPNVKVCGELLSSNALPEDAELAAELRTRLNNIEYFPPNFEGLVLGCIDADFCK